MTSAIWTTAPKAWVAIRGTLLFCLATMTLPAFSAPQIETPGFYLESVGLTLEQASEGPLYTPDGNFIPLQKASAFAFAQNADVIFAVEKFGTVRVIVDGVLQPSPVVDMKSQVTDWIDSGMGGIDVHPDFPAVKEILITYTHHNGITPIEDGSKYAKVARLTLTETVDSDGKVTYYSDPPTDNDVIIGKLSSTEEFPSCNDRPLGADCGAVDYSAHSFTFVRYGPDGKIYVGTGDGAGYFSADPHALYAQVNSHLSGKILRVNPDGSAPPDNPFFTGNKWDNESKVFAKGLRNPKSAGFDPNSGKLCVGNVGWYLTEGIYCLDPGDNVGWPCEENGPAFNGYQTLSLSLDGKRIASCPLEPGSFVQPDYSYAHQLREVNGEIIPIGAVIGCATATADEYPDSFKGTCVFGDYVFDTIESVLLGQPGGNPSSSLILSGAGLPTDVTTDRDGRICYIAYTTGNIDGRPVSEIRCLGYDSDGTVPQYPVPSFVSFPDPTNADVIKFDASRSYHTGGLAMTYEWEFGDGTSGTGVATQHQYTQPGDYRVDMTATTVGEDVSRSTFQVVRVQDPNFVTPILPSVSRIDFDVEEHTFSAPVQFDVVIRNDKGDDEFRVLTNIYDNEGLPVAHLVHDELLQLDNGESTTVTFRWESATELGDHTIGVEFYSSDWVSWVLKYPNAANFFVRNRASEGATTQGGTTEGTTTDGVTTDGSTTDGSTTDGATTDGQTTAGENPDAGTTTSGVPDGESAVGSANNGCTIGSANGSLLWIMALLSALRLLRQRRQRVSVS